MPQAAESWEAFFDPRGVVVVGASRDASKLGYGIARNLAQGRYSGAISLVNPNASGRLFGCEFHSSVADVPDPVDLAVILVRAELVPEVLVECGSRGIGAAIIASGGFRETGEVGAELEERCLVVAGEHGMRLLGPNCIGTIDTHTGFNSTFLAPPGPTAGGVAFVSHSGALCAAVIDWSLGQGFGFSRLVSLGNQADITEVEALRMVAADPRTDVITAYLETFSDGRELVDLAGRMRQPVVALKAGRGKAGSRAVGSHTGALAGHDRVGRAAFRRAGIIRADTLEDMFDAARTLAVAPLPAGRSVAVLTNAGGPGVAAVDALELEGLIPALLSETTRATLREALPPAAGIENPIDMLASASPQHFGICLQILIEAPEVDSVLVVFAPPPMHPAVEVAGAVVEVAGNSSKPVLAVVMGDHSIGPAIERLRAGHIPDFRFPEPAARSLAALTSRADVVAVEPGPPIRPDGIASDEAGAIVRAAPAGWLPPGATVEVLGAYGIVAAPVDTVVGEDDAVRSAARLGGSVVLKLAGADLTHKSDVGGVRLGLTSEQEVRVAYSDLMAVAAGMGEGSVPVSIQPMVEGSHDLIVGAIRDGQFGPALAFGSGGVETEGLGDIEFALAPVTEQDIDVLLARTWAGRRLAGYRSVPAGDIAAVKDVIRRVGWLLEDQARLVEIEINPLRALTPGSGTVALDARIRIE